MRDACRSSVGGRWLVSCVMFGVPSGSVCAYVVLERREVREGTGCSGELKDGLSVHVYTCTETCRCCAGRWEVRIWVHRMRGRSWFSGYRWMLPEDVLEKRSGVAHWLWWKLKAYQLLLVSVYCSLS